MKLLVAIASYGSRNNDYLARLSLSIVRGPGVEVVVGLPSGNPWSLPFAHKRIFAQRAEEYDLFIYAEDDTLITQANIDSTSASNTNTALRGAHPAANVS